MLEVTEQVSKAMEMRNGIGQAHTRKTEDPDDKGGKRCSQKDSQGPRQGEPVRLVHGLGHSP
jgi:hypothetical protein